MKDSEQRDIAVTVNGTRLQEVVETRLTLVDFLRERLGLTGTHVGCEHGVCGACTAVLNGKIVRSCLLFAVGEWRGDRHGGVAGQGEKLHPIQQAFWEHHALQCGLCTHGFLMTAWAFLQESPTPTPEEIRVGLQEISVAVRVSEYCGADRTTRGCPEQASVRNEPQRNGGAVTCQRPSGLF